LGNPAEPRKGADYKGKISALERLANLPTLSPLADARVRERQTLFRMKADNVAALVDEIGNVLANKQLTIDRWCPEHVEQRKNRLLNVRAHDKGGTVQGKYEPLEIYLRAVPAGTKQVTLSFAEIERILGAPLPASAKSHRAWWGNQKDSKTRPQAHSWLSAGFVVDTVNQGNSNASIRFKRAH
jgi:hypothetical protein